MKAPGWRWQDKAAGGGLMDELHPSRRVPSAYHDIRFDGFSDLLLRARGASVIDIGMNRGHIAWEFAVNGARIVHGCDVYGPGVMAARHWFAEMPNTESKFEVVDLVKPGAMQAAFGNAQYDIVLFVGVLHKLQREMQRPAIIELLKDLERRTLTYFAITCAFDDLPYVSAVIEARGLKRVHLSEIAAIGRPSVIWKRL